MPLLDDHRADWHARPPTSPLTAVPISARVGLVWHWAGPPTRLVGKPHTACLEMVRAWQLFHQTDPDRRWKDIGYNVLICPHSRAIEGRGIGVSASHSPSWNTSRIGVQFMVGQGEKVSAAMFARAVALQRAIEQLAGRDLTDACHHDDPATHTECPGPQVHTWVKAGGPDPARAPSTTPTSTTSSKETIMHTLVKLPEQDPVWLSDLITRRWVLTAKELVTVQAQLKAHGVDATVHEVSTLAPYGVPVGKVPA